MSERCVEMASAVLEETVLNVKDKLSSIFGSSSNAEEEANMGVIGRCWKETTETCQLTRLQKIICCGVLLVTGLLFCALSFAMFTSPTRFTKFYTFGSLCILAASMFVVSPLEQLRSITSDGRRTVSAVLYVLSIMLALYAALRLDSAILAAVFAVLQVGTGLWYAASFVPGAQSCLHGAASTILPI